MRFASVNLATRLSVPVGCECLRSAGVAIHGRVRLMDVSYGRCARRVV